MRILQLVSSEDTTTEELAQVISADPALTAKILKYLRSPLIGLGFEGSTVADAVARIGTRGAQLLALSFSLVSQKHHQSCPSFNFNLFWSESLARAVASKRLAAINRQWDREEAFITGLMFRIGQLVLATALPKDYELILRAASENCEPVDMCERNALGTDHYAVGYQLLQEWKMPDSVSIVMEPFAQFPRAADATTTKNSPTGLLHLADTIAVFLVGSKQQQARRMDALIAQAEELADLDRDQFRTVLDEIGQDWKTFGNLFSIATSELPDLDALEMEADEYRTTLRLAAEVEVANLRNENQQLSHLANRDRLTGLLNRGAFDDALASSIATATGKRGALALFMLDMDHFKSINDRHGHPAGDGVLRHVARILHTHAKSPADAFRYGGEEFAVLFPCGNKEEVIALAETLRQAIAQSPHVEGPKTIPLTVSIGMAWARWPEHPITSTALVQAADQRLYEAKQAGRNLCRHGLV